MNPSRPNHAAFTLAELIVAVTVTVLLAAGTVTMLRSMIASRSRSETRMADQVEACRAVEAVAGALRNASCYGSKDALLEGMEGQSGEVPADRVRFFAVMPGQVRRGEVESDVKECEFFLQGQEGSPGALMERIDPTRNERPDGGGVLKRLADHVVSLEVSYYDGWDWRRNWPADPTSEEWPEAIRVSVAVAGEGRSGRPWVASRTVAYPNARRSVGGTGTGP